MLIRITDHCTQACTHCIVDSTPSNKHMPFDEFMKAVKFAMECGEGTILISGGEPTDHPQFEDFLNYALLNFYGAVFVLSHGAFLKTKEDVDNLVGRYPNVMFQFTSDPLHYTKLISKEVITYINAQSNAYVTESLLEIGVHIYPQGRAVRMGVTPETTRSIAAKCFNLRSIVYAGHDLKSALHVLRGRQKMCTPSVNVDGSISMGESNQCPSIGQTTATQASLTDAIRCSQCDECGMIGGLEPQYKQAIGFKDKQN
ncbi:conserved hypothetical protein [Vibrio chagasii]|nr:conserved hypothetical protein [Vibrio chagasii]